MAVTPLEPLAGQPRGAPPPVAGHGLPLAPAWSPAPEPARGPQTAARVAVLQADAATPKAAWRHAPAGRAVDRHDGQVRVEAA